jgi:hypothetical protein
MNQKHLLIEKNQDAKDRFVALEDVTLCAQTPTWVEIAHSSGIASLLHSLYCNHIEKDKSKKLRKIKRIGIIVQYDD